jgi:hypothetical protein
VTGVPPSMATRKRPAAGGLCFFASFSNNLIAAALGRRGAVRAEGA